MPNELCSKASCCMTSSAATKLRTQHIGRVLLHSQWTLKGFNVGQQGWHTAGAAKAIAKDCTP